MPCHKDTQAALGRGHTERNRGLLPTASRVSQSSWQESLQPQPSFQVMQPAVVSDSDVEILLVNVTVFEVRPLADA